MLRPFLTFARTDRSPAHAASINKSVGYRSTQHSRRRPSHGRVDQDRPPYCLQYESRPYPEGAPRERCIGGQPTLTPLLYCRPSKRSCVIQIFPPLYRILPTAQSFSFLRRCVICSVYTSFLHPLDVNCCVNGKFWQPRVSTCRDLISTHIHSCRLPWLYQIVTFACFVGNYVPGTVSQSVYKGVAEKLHDASC